MIAGVLIMVGGHILAGYMDQLPTAHIDWLKVLFGHRHRQSPELIVGIIVGSVTVTIGRMYRIGKW